MGLKKIKIGWIGIVASKLEKISFWMEAHTCFIESDENRLIVYCKRLYLFKVRIAEIPKQQINAIKLLNVKGAEKQLEENQYVEGLSKYSEGLGRMESCYYFKSASKEMKNMPDAHVFLKIEWGDQGLIFVSNHPVLDSKEGDARYAWETLREEAGMP